MGPFQLTVVGAVDEYSTRLRDLKLRLDDGQDIEQELVEGRALVERRMRAPGLTAVDRAKLDALAAAGENIAVAVTPTTIAAARATITAYDV